MTAAIALILTFAASSSEYRSQISEWRAEREAGLKAEGGWLTVAGLFPLEEGENRAGHGPDARVELPSGPAFLGSFRFAKGATTFVPAANAELLINGKRISAATTLKSDEGGAKPDVVAYQDYAMTVIKRGTRYFVRLRDPHSQMRKEFTGLRWYPVRDDLRIEARFVSYPKPKTISVPNVLKEDRPEQSIGYAEFSYQGQTLRIEPVVEDDHLFYIFKDQTAGKETYPAGRFLYSGFPKDGRVVLDFNKAHNPPCAFTPFATCPLPPPQNRLAVRIEAGEKNYGRQGDGEASGHSSGGPHIR